MGRRGANSLSSKKRRQRREKNKQRLNGFKHNLYNRRPGPKMDLPDKKSAMSNRYTDDKSRWQSNRNNGVSIHDGNFGRTNESKGVCDLEFYNSGYQSTPLYDASRETCTRIQTNYPRKSHSRVPNVSSTAPDNSKAEHHVNGGWTESATSYPIQTVSSNRLLNNQFGNNHPVLPADHHSAQYVNSRLAPPNNHPNHILNRGPNQPGYNGSAHSAYLHPSQHASRHETYPNGTAIDPRMKHSQALHNVPAIPNRNDCVEISAVQIQENSATSKPGGPINYMRPQQILQLQQKEQKAKLPSPLRPGAKDLLNNDSTNVSTAIAKSLMQMGKEVTEKCVPDLQEGDSTKSAPNRNKYDNIKGIKIRVKHAGLKDTQNNDSSTPAIGILTNSQNETELDKVPNDYTVKAQPLMPESSTLSNKQNSQKTPRSGSVLSGNVDKIAPVEKCVNNLSLEANKTSVKGAHLIKNVKAGKLNNLTAFKKSVKNSIQESKKKITEKFPQSEIVRTKSSAKKMLKNSTKVSNKVSKERSPQIEVAGTKKNNKTVTVIKPVKDSSKELIDKIVKKPSKNVGAKKLDKNSAEKRSVKNLSNESSKKINEKPPENLVKNEPSKKIVKNLPAGLIKKTSRKLSENAFVKTKSSKNCSDAKSEGFPATANVQPKGNGSVPAEKRTITKNLSNKLNANSIRRPTGSMGAKRPNKSAAVKNVKKLSTKVPVRNVMHDQSEVTSIELVQVENPQDSDSYSPPDPEEPSRTENHASKSENDSQTNTEEKASSISQNIMSPIQSLASWLQSGRDSEEVTELLSAEEVTEWSYQVKSCLKKSSSVANDSTSLDPDTSCTHQPTPVPNHEPTSSSTPPVTPSTLDKFIRNLLGQPQITIPDEDEHSLAGRSNLKIIPRLNQSSTRNRNGKEGKHSPAMIDLRDSPSPPLVEPDSQEESQPIVIIDDSSSDDDVILVEHDVEDNPDNGLDDNTAVDDDLDEELLLKDDYDLSSIGSDRIDDILADDLEGEENMECNDVVKRVESEADLCLETTSETSQNNSDLRPKSDLVSFARLLKRRSSSSDQSPSCSSTTPDLSADKMDTTPNPVENIQVCMYSTEVETCSKFVGKSSTGIENEAESTIANEVEVNNVDKVEKLTGGILHGWYYDDEDDEEIVSSSSAVHNLLAEPDSSNSETPNLLAVQNNHGSETHKSTSIKSPSSETDLLVGQEISKCKIPKSLEIKDEPVSVQVGPDCETHKPTSIQSPSSEIDSLVGHVNMKSEISKSLEIKDEPDSLKISSPLVGQNSDSETHYSPVIQSNSVSSTDSSVVAENLDDNKDPLFEENSDSVTIKAPVMQQNPDSEGHHLSEVQDNPDCGKHDLPATQANCDFQNNTLPEVNDEFTSITSSLPVIQRNSNQAVNLSEVEEVKTHTFERGNVNKGEEGVDISTSSVMEQASEPLPPLVPQQFDQLVSEFEKFENESNIPEKDDASNTIVSNGDHALGGSLTVSLTNTSSLDIIPRIPADDKTKEMPGCAIDCTDVSWVDPLAPCERICVMMGKPRNSSDDVDMDIKSELVSEVIVQPPPVTLNYNEASGMSIDPSCKTEPPVRSVSFDDSRIIQKNVRKRRSESDGESLHSNTEGECTRVKLPRMVSEARSVSLDQPTSSNSKVNASKNILKLVDFVHTRTPDSFNQMNNVISDIILPNNLKPSTTNCRRVSDDIGETSTEQTAADPTVVDHQTVTIRKMSSSLQAPECQGFNTSLADYVDGDDSQTDDMSELQILSYTSLTTNKKVIIANSNPTQQSQHEGKYDNDEVEIVSFTAPTICLFCNNRLKRKKACECDLSNKYIKSEPADSRGSEVPNPTNAGTSSCNQAANPIKVERRESRMSFAPTSSSHPTGSAPEIPAVASVSTQNVQQLQATSQRPLVTGAPTFHPAVNQQTPNNQITTQPISSHVDYQAGNTAVQQTLPPNNNPSGTSAVAPVLSSKPQMVNSIPYQQSVLSTTPLVSTSVRVTQKLPQQRLVPNYPPPPYHYPQTASELTGKQQVSPSTVIDYFPANSNIVNNGNIRVTATGYTQSVGGATNQCQSTVTSSNMTMQQQQSNYQPNQFSNNVNSSVRFVGNQATIAAANHQNHSHVGSRDNLSSIGLNTTASFNRQTSVDSQSNKNAQQNYIVTPSQQTISSYQNPHTGAGQPHSSKLPQARQTFKNLLQKKSPQSSNSGTSANLQQQQQILVQRNFQQQQLQPQQIIQQNLQQQRLQQHHLQQQQHLQKLHQQRLLQQRHKQQREQRQLQQQQWQSQLQQRQLQQQPSNVQPSSSVSSTNAPVPNANGFYQSINHPQNVAFSLSCNTGATTGVGTSSSIPTFSTSTGDQHVGTRTSTSSISSLPDSELSKHLRTAAAADFIIHQTQANPTTQTSSQFSNNQQGHDCASKRLRAILTSKNIQTTNQTQQQVELTHMPNNRPSSLSSNCSSQSSSPNETNVLLNNQQKSTVHEQNFGFGMIDIRMFAPVVYVKLATITNSPDSLRCYCRRHLPYCMLLRQSITNGAVDIPVKQPLIRCKEIVELLQCKPEALYKSVTFANVKSLCRIPYFSAVIDGVNVQEVRSNINLDAEAFLTCCISFCDFITLIFPKFCHDRYGALGNNSKKLFKMTTTKTMQLDELSKVQKFQRIFSFNNRKFKQEDQTLMVYPPDDPPLPTVLPI